MCIPHADDMHYARDDSMFAHLVYGGVVAEGQPVQEVVNHIVWRAALVLDGCECQANRPGGHKGAGSCSLAVQ